MGDGFGRYVRRLMNSGEERAAETHVACREADRDLLDRGMMPLAAVQIDIELSLRSVVPSLWYRIPSSLENSLICASDLV